MTQIILSSGSSWTVPADWNSSNNTVECIGAGASGSGTISGGGGAYAKISNFSPSGGTVSYQIGSPSTTASISASWFGSTATVLAAGANGSNGGTTAGSTGAVKYAGGNGGNNVGAGGAAGPNGNGVTPIGSAGGAGDNGSGGAGGASGSGGGSGTEFGTVGAGGGGGYGSSTGGSGGNYGGGGGGGFTPGVGAPGLIVITYTPAASPISGSLALGLSLSGTLHDAGGHISGNIALGLALQGTLTAVPHIAPLAGAINLALGLSGTLGAVAPISGHTAFALSMQGTLSGVGPLRGSVALALGLSGTLRDANAGARFYQMFVNVYTARQTLLNAIYAASKADADTANTQLAAIASDNILSPGEKSVVIRDYNALIAEQAGIDAQAVSNGLSTSTYDSALSALTAYLATLTTPKAWNDKSGNTTIVGATFRANFAAVYSARQALLNSMDSAMIIANPNFLNGLSGWTPNGSGWSAQTGPTQNPYITSYAQFASGSANAQLFNNTGYPCQPGDSFACSAQITGVSGSGSASAGIAFFQSNGTLAQAFWGDHISGSASGTSRVVATAPANAVSANAAISVGNYTGTGSYQFSGVTLDAMPNSIDEVQDGTTYAKILGSQLTNGQHNLEVAGSGHQLGDQRALLPVNSAGPVSNWRNLTISYTASPTSATISVSAASIVGILPNAVWLNYNASSATVSGSTGTSKTYYLYYNDPHFAGGTQALSADTNGNNIYTLGYVYIGTVTVTFPTSGSGGGGGSGGLCVADDMWIAPGLRAGDAQIGDPFDCIDLPTQAGKHQRALQGLTRGTEECARMITSNGCALVCSLSTPFDLPDGRGVTALQMLGERVITDLGIATVTSIALVGPKPVTRAHLGGVSYAAGADPHRRVYSHNGSPAKP